MGNDNSSSNVIALHDNRPKKSTRGDVDCDIENVSEFIVDMLGTLMQMAEKKDHSLLVYFLAMARIEASEMSKPGDKETESS